MFTNQIFLKKKKIVDLLSLDYLWKKKKKKSFGAVGICLEIMDYRNAFA